MSILVFLRDGKAVVTKMSVVGGRLMWWNVVICLCSYLLVLDRTNWRTNLLTAVLVPYLALQLPQPFFGYLRYSTIYNELTFSFAVGVRCLVGVLRSSLFRFNLSHSFRGGIGAWIAFIAVVIRLFFAQKFPELINRKLLVILPGVVVQFRPWLPRSGMLTRCMFL